MSSFLRQRRQGVVVFVVITLCFNAFVFVHLVNQLFSSCKITTEEEAKEVPNLALQAYNIYNRKAQQENKLLDATKLNVKRIVNLTLFNRTDYAKCKDFNKLPRAKQAVKENVAGNRGITFMKISIGGVVLDVVHKEASQ